MHLVPTNPFWFLDAVENVFNKEFSKNLVKGPGFPKADVYKQNNQFVVVMDLPGYDKKDVVVEIDEKNHQLFISGRSVQNTEKRQWIVKERSSTAFSKAYWLPEDVKGEPKTRIFENGQLTLTWDLQPEVSNVKRIEF